MFLKKTAEGWGVGVVFLGKNRRNGFDSKKKSWENDWRPLHKKQQSTSREQLLIRANRLVALAAALSFVGGFRCRVAFSCSVS